MTDLIKVKGKEKTLIISFKTKITGEWGIYHNNYEF